MYSKKIIEGQEAGFALGFFYANGKTWSKPGVGLVQIFRRIHAYLCFHVYLSDILHFPFLMHVTSKRGPYIFM